MQAGVHDDGQSQLRGFTGGGPNHHCRLLQLARLTQWRSHPRRLTRRAHHPFFNRCGGGRYSGVELDVPTDDPPTPPVSPPSSPARACIEAARPMTTRFALEDSLSSFATALESDVGGAVDAAAHC